MSTEKQEKSKPSKLEEALEAAGLSKADLARGVGVSKAAVGKWVKSGKVPERAWEWIHKSVGAIDGRGAAARVDRPVQESKAPREKKPKKEKPAKEVVVDLPSGPVKLKVRKMESMVLGNEAWSSCYLSRDLNPDEQARCREAKKALEAGQPAPGGAS